MEEDQDVENDLVFTKEMSKTQGRKNEIEQEAVQKENKDERVCRHLKK